MDSVLVSTLLVQFPLFTAGYPADCRASPAAIRNFIVGGV
jgi:hypothetical protein